MGVLGMSAMPMTSAMGMRMPLLPEWLRVVWVVALAVVLVLHLQHARVMLGQARRWHGSHILMAAGMIGMYLLPQMHHAHLYWAGLVLFAVLTIAVASMAMAVARRGGRMRWFWRASTAGMLTMAYMFLPAADRPAAVTYIFVAYLGTEAFGWLVGPDRLRRWVSSNVGVSGADAVDPRIGTAASPAPTSAGPAGAVLAADHLIAATGRADGASESACADVTVGVRVTLAVMAASMAWMLVAMQNMQMMPGMHM